MLPLCDVIPSRRTPIVTIALIVVSALTAAYGPAADRASAPGAFGAPLGWLPMLVSPFVHLGWVSAIASMVCVWIFGDNIEGVMGRLPFFVFYCLAGVLGVAAYAAASPGAAWPVPAASAPVAAVVAAYFVLYPRSQVLVLVFLIVSVDVLEVPAVFVAGFWLLLHFLIGTAAIGAGVPSGAVFGPVLAGAAVGALSGLVLRRQVRWE